MATINEYLRCRPQDPLAHSLSAAVRFYDHISWRLSERDSQSIVSVLLGPGLAMPPALQKEVAQSLREAQTLATKSLSTDRDDRAAILTLCIVAAVNRDGLALVSKRWSASLAQAERAHKLAARLIAQEPLAHDAYFFFGSTEYLVAQVPAVVRPFVQIAGVSGDRKKAIHYYEIAAKSGWYFQEFARRSLVSLYVEEGRLPDAIRTLGGLMKDFPDNPMVRADYKKLTNTARNS